MSDRQRVREFLADKVLGRHMWYTRTSPSQHMCRNAPECGLPEDNHEAAAAVQQAYREADEAYVSIMDRVDWNRILMLASSRHDLMRTKHPDQHKDDPFLEEICGDCVNQAVMIDGFGQYSWPEDLDTPSRTYEPRKDRRAV